jgi:hypothetical protein
MGFTQLGRAAFLGLIAIIAFQSMSNADVETIAPVEAAKMPAQVSLTADRTVGFVPMKLNLSGTVQTKAGDLLPVSSEQRIRVVVESARVRVHNSMTITNMMPDYHYETSAPGPTSPGAFRRAVEIRRPGTYTFRVQVIAADGSVLSSNDVSVKVL